MSQSAALRSSISHTGPSPFWSASSSSSKSNTETVLKNSGVGNSSTLGLESGVGQTQTESTTQVQLAQTARMNAQVEEQKSAHWEKGKKISDTTSKVIGISGAVATAATAVLVGCGVLSSFFPVGTIIGAVGGAATLLCVGAAKLCKTLANRHNDEAQGYYVQEQAHLNRSAQLDQISQNTASVGSDTLVAMKKYEEQKA